MLGFVLNEAARPLWNWRKRWSMRRHLYKELAFNYAIFCNVLQNPIGLVNYPTDRSYPVELKYYTHALKDMDTFHDLPDYGHVVSIFDEIALIPTLHEQALVVKVVNVKAAISDAILDGTISKWLLRWQAGPWGREQIDKELEERAAYRTILQRAAGASE